MNSAGGGSADIWDLESQGGCNSNQPDKAPSTYYENTAMVGVAFYRNPPVDDSAGPTNPLARRRGGPEAAKGFWSHYVEDPLIRSFTKNMIYKHCEIAFTKDLIQGTPIPDGNVLAYGIIRDGTLFGKHRTFSSKQYEWKWISLPQKQCLAMQAFCMAQVGKPYDNAAAKRSAFWPKATDDQQWYCTDFVVSVLQQGGIMRGINPRSQTTDDVYDVVSQQGNLVQRASPFQRVKNEIDAKKRKNFKDPTRIVYVHKT